MCSIFHCSSCFGLFVVIVTFDYTEPGKRQELRFWSTRRRTHLHSSLPSDIKMELTNPEADQTCLEKMLEKLSCADSPYCPKVDKYEILKKIGEGTYGEVFKACYPETKKLVALKKILAQDENEGFPLSGLREIKILQLVNHENVVKLIEICKTAAKASNNYRLTYYLVLEFCEHDLAGLLYNVNVKFSLGEIKMVMKQLFCGLYYIHCKKILHRDMKSANILITKGGTLKIADFSLARAFGAVENADRVNNYTNKVVTLWYRPPELLLGDTNYGPAIDMWGAGCIMAEMWKRRPIMQGDTEQHQLSLICRLCGSITPASFPGCEKLDLWNHIKFPMKQKRKVKSRFKAYVQDPHALDLLNKLLIIDPMKRIDSHTALNHDFFCTDPFPCELTKMLESHSQSMFSTISGPVLLGESQPNVIANNGQNHDRFL